MRRAVRAGLRHPPPSPHYLPTIWRWRQIRAWRGPFTLNANRRKPSRCKLAELRGIFSTRRKSGSLQGSKIFPDGMRAHGASLKVRAKTLVDTERVYLRRPFERQVDPVEQRVGAKISRLTSLANRFDDSGCYE